MAGARCLGWLVGVILEQGPVGGGVLGPGAHGIGHNLRSLLDGGQEGLACRACMKQDTAQMASWGTPGLFRSFLVYPT